MIIKKIRIRLNVGWYSFWWRICRKLGRQRILFVVVVVVVPCSVVCVSSQSRRDSLRFAPNTNKNRVAGFWSLGLAELYIACFEHEWLHRTWSVSTNTSNKRWWWSLTDWFRHGNGSIFCCYFFLNFHLGHSQWIELLRRNKVRWKRTFCRWLEPEYNGCHFLRTCSLSIECSLQCALSSEFAMSAGSNNDECFLKIADPEWSRTDNRHFVDIVYCSLLIWCIVDSFYLF